MGFSQFGLNKRFAAACLFFCLAPLAWAVPIRPMQLEEIRQKVLAMQQSLIEGEKAQARAQDQARSQIRKIQTLLQLQKQERQVAGERMKELERTVGELEERRALLREKIAVKKDQVRTRLRSIGAAMIEGEAVDAQSVFVSENEGWETLTRHVQAGVARASVREIEELKVDLEDARMLEQQIETEKQQLAYLFQDIEEQEGVLQLNQQIQMDLIRREHQSRLAQLDHYRRLKLAESNVQKMLGEFNARRELQKQVEADRLKTRVQRAMQESIFGRQQGKLPMPVRGTIVGRFGKSLDPGSRLMVFKKGIEIQTEAGAPVTAVASGRVAFAGDLPNYGRVLILDHGDHYYSLSGHLGDIALKAGDSIEAGALVGHAEASGTPVYFEIRSRNIAVNPLQWVASSFSLNP